MKTTTDKSNVISQILLSAVAIALGYLLLFNKSMQLLTICQFLCGGMILVGVVSIISFFVSGNYKRIDRYGFTLGILMILLAGVGFLRMNELTANFDIIAGLLALILSILTLQGSVQVRRHHVGHKSVHRFLPLGPSGKRCVLPLQSDRHMDLHPACRKA